MAQARRSNLREKKRKQFMFFIMLGNTNVNLFYYWRILIGYFFMNERILIGYFFMNERILIGYFFMNERILINRFKFWGNSVSLVCKLTAKQFGKFNNSMAIGCYPFI